MVGCLAGESSLCGDVVLSQCPTLDTEMRARVWRRNHHLPGPWVGRLEQAPLLFLSSNPFSRHSYDDSSLRDPQPPLPEFNGATIDDHPSLGRPFEAPKAEWTDDQIVDKGEAMFDVWTEPTGTRAYKNPAGDLDKPVPYWKAARLFATSVFDRPVRPGIDYALTEIVRCRSPEELGVERAATKCVPLYLERTLALSPAPVIAVLGRRARQVIRTMTGYADYGPVSPPLRIANRDRIVVFLAHPTARRSKYPKQLDKADLVDVRAQLAAFDRGRKFRWEEGDIRIV